MTGRLVALAAGGTGGHLFPAEALATEMKRRGWRVLLVTDDRGARYADNFPADDRARVSAATPSIGGPAAKVLAALSLAGGLINALRLLKKQKVDVAVGFGGYPSVPTMKAAEILKIPYGVHEQNGVLGRANRLVTKRAEFIASGFLQLELLPPGARPRHIVVGNPVREAVLEHAGAPYPSIVEGGRIRLLVFGGSQGARIIADVVPQAIAELPAALRSRIDVVQQAREEDLERVKSIYSRAGVSAEVAPFFRDLPARMANAHLVIARSGASSVTELSVIGRPSLLVPLAIAMDDHQWGNARALEDVGAAIALREQGFTVDRVSQELATLLTASTRLAQMAAAARRIAPDKAAARLADLVEAAAASGQTHGAA